MTLRSVARPVNHLAEMSAVLLGQSVAVRSAARELVTAQEPVLPAEKMNSRLRLLLTSR